MSVLVVSHRPLSPDQGEKVADRPDEGGLVSSSVPYKHHNLRRHHTENTMLGIILGVFTILLGAKAFSRTGLPLTKTRNITGTTGKVIGVICILLGVLLIVDGVFGASTILSLLSKLGQ